MTRTPTPLSEELFDYLCAHGTPPDLVQSRLIAETAALGHEARLQVSPDEGTFLTLLTELTGSRTALEIRTRTHPRPQEVGLADRIPSARAVDRGGFCPR
ncbi:hypothetical protein [Streptomyces sp. NPDC049906]|uniref:hypothetical protein n=1 Tax=Streptomyces sp. NPDC049906 TaxID=3155656 RepID=UPI00342A10B5